MELSDYIAICLFFGFLLFGKYEALFWLMLLYGAYKAFAKDMIISIYNDLSNTNNEKN